MSTDDRHLPMENIIDLLMLILLQAVLGFDNLLYISLESKRAPLEKQKAVRIWGIGLAVILRIVLLFVLLKMMELLPVLLVQTGYPFYLCGHQFRLTHHPARRRFHHLHRGQGDHPHA